jgi:hypothetical protein
MIVGMIPTYKEGKLARDAIFSILPVCNSVVVFEGPIKGAPDSGIDSVFRNARGKLDPRILLKNGSWNSEVHKRNQMLEYTRRFKPPVWGIYLDADEVMLWPEYIESYIEACDAQAPEGQVNVACPLLRVEIDGSVQTLKRIIRLDLLEQHMLSMSQWKFYGSDIAVTFPAIPSDRSPNQGEPHIFHRAFLRPMVRGGFRLYEREIEDFQILEKTERERLGLTDIPAGAIPVQKDGVFVPVEQGDKNVSPHSPLLEIPSTAEIARQTKQK